MFLSKRFLTFLLLLMFSFITLLTVSAKEPEEIISDGGFLQKSVAGIYEKGDDGNIFSDIILDGKASVTTKNGIIINLSAKNAKLPTGTIFKVREVMKDSGDAFAWFSKAGKGQGTNIIPFHVYFEREGKLVEPEQDFTIDIKLPDTYEKPFLLSVSTQGVTSKISSAIKDGLITFIASKSGYVMLMEENKIPLKPPGAGDNIRIPLLFAITMTISASTALFVIKSKQQKDRG